MWTDAILAYLHYLAIFGVAAHLALEFALLRGEVRGDILHRLARADISYFAAAIATLVTGGLRMGLGAKGAAFYTGNPVFYAKMGVFAAVALISITPTLVFIRWAKQARASAGFVPPAAEITRTRRFVMVELLLFASLPFFAALMARGIGM